MALKCPACQARDSSWFAGVETLEVIRAVCLSEGTVAGSLAFPAPSIALAVASRAFEDFPVLRLLIRRS